LFFFLSFSSAKFSAEQLRNLLCEHQDLLKVKAGVCLPHKAITFASSGLPEPEPTTKLKEGETYVCTICFGDVDEESSFLLFFAYVKIFFSFCLLLSFFFPFISLFDLRMVSLLWPRMPLRVYGRAIGVCYRR
jgi:hypothetical protein